MPSASDTPAKSPALPASRYLCIHGHFYQPPRENPWLDAVERQPSAAPAHDWNERVSMECYGPNAAARIVSGDNRIIDIRNNYEKISFNFGPTLLSWMERHQPETYAEILAADARSAAARGGHGNALAQVHSHVIMPLQTKRDKVTQVLWGLEDFRARFHRDAEGMWLSECAVDTETLEVLAQSGVRYTILAPRQAKAWRGPGDKDWRTRENGGIDPSRPYRCVLPSGREIVLFFYDGPISQAVAFENLLVSGDRFAARMAQGFSTLREWPQLVHLATDGESYGHHHRHGEMALAYALHAVEARGLARLTNYGEFLELHPPEAEARIWENSSWSCVHGVERWRSDCGCNTGGRPNWHQKWRGPLREAYDILKSESDKLFESEGGRLLRAPWTARDEYVRVLLKQEDAGAFVRRHLRVAPDADNVRDALRLLEIQRNAMLIYTSCAWFFDEVSGIETVQTLRYAARLLQIIRPWAPDLEECFVSRLAKARSNLPEFRDGARIWKQIVAPQVVDLHRVIADCAILNFDRIAEGPRTHYCFRIEEKDARTATYGDARLTLARVKAEAPLTGASTEATVCVLHLGGHDFVCRIGPALDGPEYDRLHNELLSTFSRRSLAEVIRAIDRNFGGRDYTLADLFAEDREEILDRVMSSSVQRFDSTLVMMFDENRRLMEYLRESGAVLPQGFTSVAEYVLRTRLQAELKAYSAEHDARAALGIAAEARHLGVRIDDADLNALLARTLSRVFHDLARSPSDELCRRAAQLLDVIEMLGARLDLWEAQNICFALVTGRPLPATISAPADELPLGLSTDLPALRELAARLRISDTPMERPPAQPAVEASTSRDAVARV